MKKVLSLVLSLLIVFSAMSSIPISASAGTKVAYEVTKSDGSVIRNGYNNQATVVGRAAYGSIVWVVGSVKNSAGNIWYKLTSGYWIYSGNVKKHSCTWVVTYKNAPTCTKSGYVDYKCNKCGATKRTNYSAIGHNYKDGMCTRCSSWTYKSVSEYSQRMVVYNSGAKIHSAPYGAATTTAYPSKGVLLYATKKYINSSGNTWYKVDGGYIFSDYVKAHSSCTWNSGTVTKKPTCTATGTKVYTCTLCYSTKSATLSALGHTNNSVCTRCGYWSTSSFKSTTSLSNEKYVVTSSEAKIHSGPYGATPTVSTPAVKTILYATQKIVNAQDNVWYKVNGGYIFSDYVKKHTSCTWNSGVYVTKPTCTATGTKKYTCTLCGATKTTTVKALGHSGSGACSRCGYWSTSSLKSVTSLNNEKYLVISSDAKIHTGPYGATQTISTPAVKTILYATQKIVNAQDNVWYKVNGGYIFSDYVKKHTSCTWNSGTVTKKPTCTATGTKKYTCTLCGATKTTTVKALGHSNNSVCTRCGYWSTSSFKSTTTLNNVKYVVTSSDAKIHSGPYGATQTVSTPTVKTILYATQKIVNAQDNVWYKVNGGYIFSDYVKKHTSCTWNSGKITKSPTCTATGTKKYTCTLCGATKTTTVSAWGHTYKNGVCERCKAWNTKSIKVTDLGGKVRYVVTSADAKIHSGPYGATKTLSTPATKTLLYATQKVVNAQDNVWYKVDGGYIYSSYVKKHTSCTWNSGTVTKKPTCTVKGVRTYKCTVCTSTKTTSISATGHTFSSYICTKCQDWDKSSVVASSLNNVAYAVYKDGATIYAGPYSKCKIVSNPVKGAKLIATQKITNAYGNTWYKVNGGYIYNTSVTSYSLYYATISLNKTSITVYKNQLAKITATVSGPSQTVKWTTSDSSIATVDSNGNVYGVSVGTATITATANGKKATCTVKVANPSIKLPTSVTLYVGDTKTLNATLNGVTGTVAWSSNNTSVATVNSSGVVTCKKAGTATISAKVNGLIATCKVTVNAATITLAETSKILYTGCEFKLNAVTSASSNSIVWSSSNTSVATVDSNGLVTGLSVGEAIITAKIGDATDSCKVIVNGVNNVATINNLDDLTQEQLSFISFSDVCVVREKNEWYYQFTYKIFAITEIPNCMRISVSAFYDLNDNGALLTQNYDCNKVASKLTQSLNESINNCTNGSSNIDFTLASRGHKIVDSEKVYSTQLTSFSLSEALYNNTITLSTKRLSDKTVEFNFIEKYATMRVSSDSAKENNYLTAMSKTSVSNNEFIPTFKIAINNSNVPITSQKLLGDNSYSVVGKLTKINYNYFTSAVYDCSGYFDQNTIDNYLQNFVKVATTNGEYSYITSAPASSDYVALDSISTDRTKVLNLAFGDGDYSFSRGFALSNDYNKEFVIGAMYNSPVKLKKAYDTFSVETRLNSNVISSNSYVINISFKN